MNYNNILRAHAQTQLTTILHGSSGFGKTSTIRAYAKEFGLKIIDKRLSMIDPLTIFMPRVVDDKIEMVMADWVHEMLTATAPVVVFFDEITNPSSPELFNIMKELLGERTIFGHKIPNCVQFVGASNLVSEDSGVKELPDSLWKRATHLAFAPDMNTMLEHLPESAQSLFSRNPQLMFKPKVEEFPLTAVPRQINNCVALFETGLLDKTEARICFAGRIGTEAGYALAEHLFSLKKQERVYPKKLTEKNFKVLVAAEEEGLGLEVVQYLKGEQPKDIVALYLATTASPEVCRAMYEAKISLPPVNKELNGLPANLAWVAYAAARKAIVIKVN